MADSLGGIDYKTGTISLATSLLNILHDQIPYTQILMHVLVLKLAVVESLWNFPVSLTSTSYTLLIAWSNKEICKMCAHTLIYTSLKFQTQS